MKYNTILILGLLMSILNINLIGQDDSIKQKLPPMDQLPKIGETKIFYEFDAVYQYQLLNDKKYLLSEGTSQFVDVTDLSNGIYYFNFNGTTEKYEVNGCCEQTKPMSKELPPYYELPVLPGESKTFYELDEKYEFELYDSNGMLVEKGNLQFIETTKYPVGVYYIKYDGKTDRFVKN